MIGLINSKILSANSIYWIVLEYNNIKGIKREPCPLYGSLFVSAKKLIEGRVPMKQRALQFIKYVNKVYGLSQQLFCFTDGRVAPQIPLKEILFVTIFSIVVNVHSFNKMEALLQMGYFNKALKKKKAKGSADTFGYGLARSLIKQFEQLNAKVIRTSRYNKVLQQGTIDGFTVVALDGTEVFRTQSKAWSSRKVPRHGKDQT